MSQIFDMFPSSCFPSIGNGSALDDDACLHPHMDVPPNPNPYPSPVALRGLWSFSALGHLFSLLSFSSQPHGFYMPLILQSLLSTPPELFHLFWFTSNAWLCCLTWVEMKIQVLRLVLWRPGMHFSVVGCVLSTTRAPQTHSQPRPGDALGWWGAATGWLRPKLACIWMRRKRFTGHSWSSTQPVTTWWH